MSRELIENVKRSQFLLDQVITARIGRGCQEIALQALGADIHLQEIIDGDQINGSSLYDSVRRKGLDIEWIHVPEEDLNNSDIRDLLNGRTLDIPSSDRHKAVGFLFAEVYPDGTQTQHAIAILPRSDMPRDYRKILKEQDKYPVVNTNFPSCIDYVESETLANYANGVRTSGGHLEIAKIVR